MGFLILDNRSTEDPMGEGGAKDPGMGHPKKAKLPHEQFTKSQSGNGGAHL